MQLYLLDLNKSFDLFKAEGSPPGGGGPIGAPKVSVPKAPKAPKVPKAVAGPKAKAAPKPKAPPAPKPKAAPKPKVPGTPPAGAASASSATPPAAPTGRPKGGEAKAAKPEATGGAAKQQIVDCPLGGACPDGGRHRMGSGKLQEHTEQAQSKLGTQAKPSEEEKPGEPGAEKLGEPSVEKPAAAAPTDPKIGGVGSGPAESPERGKKETIQLKTGEYDISDKPGKAEPKFDPITGEQKKTVELKTGEYKLTGSKRDPNFPKDRDSVFQVSNPLELQHYEKQGWKLGPNDMLYPPHQRDLFERDFEAHANSFRKKPASTAAEQGEPAAIKPNLIPALHHYRLAKNAREAGNQELAAQQENLAKEKSANFSSEDHKDISESLKSEGLNDQAEYHSKIHSRVGELKAEPSAAEQQAQEAKQEEPKAESPILETDESKISVDSKPMDHYRLAKIARESGDENLAKEHENIGKRKALDSFRGHEEHKELADQLAAEGLHDQANFHSKIHDKVKKQTERTQGRKEHAAAEPADESAAKLREQNLEIYNPERSHEEQRAKAKADFKAAKDKHAETKAKADKLRAENEEKIKKYEADLSDHEERKKAAKEAKDKSSVKKVGNPPKKPKLEKVEDVPERPELYEPESDIQKLQHQTHTEKAKKLAEIAESHLKNNPNLSESERSRLENIHKMASYHANVEHVPTAAHKQELNELHRAAGGMGVKSHAKPAPTPAAAPTPAGKPTPATGAPGAGAPTPTPEAKKPESDIEHAKVADHKSKAKELRTNLESHINNNPDLSPEDREKAQRIINVLKEHENVEGVPSEKQSKELKEVSTLSGKHGKKPHQERIKKEEKQKTEERMTADTGGPSTASIIGGGQALGAAIAAAATSPEAAGGIGSAVVNYATTGLFGSGPGHKLLQKQENTTSEETSGKQGGEVTAGSEKKTSSSGDGGGGGSSSREAALGKQSEFTQDSPGRSTGGQDSPGQSTSEKTSQSAGQQSTPGQASQSQSSSQSTSGGQSKGPRLFLASEAGPSGSGKDNTVPGSAKKSLKNNISLFLRNKTVIQMHGWR